MQCWKMLYCASIQFIWRSIICEDKQNYNTGKILFLCTWSIFAVKCKIKLMFILVLDSRDSSQMSFVRTEMLLMIITYVEYFALYILICSIIRNNCFHSWNWYKNTYVLMKLYATRFQRPLWYHRNYNGLQNSNPIASANI